LSLSEIMIHFDPQTLKMNEYSPFNPITYTLIYSNAFSS